MLSSPVTHTNTHAQQSASNFTLQGILFLVQLHSLIYAANALNSVCVRVEVGCRCGLAEVVDGNVLSRSHEELQLLNKTGSAMTVLYVFVFVGVFFLSLPFTTLCGNNRYT